MIDLRVRRLYRQYDSIQSSGVGINCNRYVTKPKKKKERGTWWWLLTYSYLVLWRSKYVPLASPFCISPSASWFACIAPMSILHQMHIPTYTARELERRERNCTRVMDKVSMRLIKPGWGGADNAYQSLTSGKHTPRTIVMVGYMTVERTRNSRRG